MPVDEDEQKAIDRGDFLEDVDDDEEDESEDELEEELEDEDEDDDTDVDDEDVGEGEEEEEDSEDEGGEDEEGDASVSEDEEDEEEDDDGSDQRVPLSRLNRVIEQRNKETERVEWLEEQLEKLIEQGTLPQKEEETPEPFDFAEAESKYVDLILEGATQDAADLRSAIDSERANLLKEEMTLIREDAVRGSRDVLETEKFDIAIDNFKNKYEFLDDENDAYNEEAVDTTNALMSSFMASGDSKTKALQKAVDRIAPMYNKKPAEKLGKKNTKRTKETRKRNVSTMKKTPPSIKGKKGSTRNLDDVAVDKMSEKQFRGLSNKEKAILRGDIV